MRYLILACLLCLQFSGFCQEPLWLRYPSISPDGKTIAFTYKGDIYTVPSSGGRAMALTIHDAHDFMPVWSKDGKTIAFASDRYGNFDIFTIPAEGGNATRLTYHSANEYPYSYSADNLQVLFSASRMDAVTNRQYPAPYLSELYQAPVIGGRVEQLLTTPAENVRLSNDGKTWIYEDVKCQENTWRKHHQSSAARDIWFYNTLTKKHTKLTDFKGEDRNAVFMPDESGMYYLSEESGSFNIHSKKLQEGASTQLTSFKTHPVRFLSSSKDGILCFAYDGSLYTLQPGNSAVKVNITLPSDARFTTQEIDYVTEGTDMVVSPNGKEFAFLYRGNVFVAGTEGGSVKQITRTPETEHAVSFSPDGNSIIYCSERNGRWDIYETKMARDNEHYFHASTLLKETTLFNNNNSNTQPLYSPDGNEIAYIEDRNKLCVYNLKTKIKRVLLNENYLFSMGDNDQNFSWGPDSKWILFQYSVPGSNPTEIGLVSVDGKKVENLTMSGFYDVNPKWILGGNAIIWFSNRDGLRSASMTGGGQFDVYGLFLNQKSWDDFNLTEEEAKLKKILDEKNKEKEDEEAEKETKNKKKKNKTEPADTLVIEWDGLRIRKVKLTIHSSDLGDALVSKDGEKLYYLASFEKDMNLWTTNLRTKETRMVEKLNTEYGVMSWDKDQSTIFINTSEGFLKFNPDAESSENISVSGEMTYDLNKEMQTDYEHVCRKTAQTFYTAGYHGIDWKNLSEHYKKFLPHLGNKYEFSELLNELLGELNVSHSGSSYAAGNANADMTASFGAFYSADHRGVGLKVEEVLKGGPLDKEATRIKAGSVILAVDGDTILTNTDYAKYLNRKAGKKVLLAIRENNTIREIIVKPITLREERSLLYKRWVNRNAAEVDSLSNGQLGYVHIPGMDDGSFRTTFEETLGKHFGKKGLVVDTRNNGGGDLVADLEMFLSGKKFIDYGTDNRLNGYEPNFRWTKPSISLANEANYSDGHCYAYMMKQSHIGQLVGMPVPGTCTFGGWEMLTSGDIRWGVPSVGCKDPNGNYLENAQTEPDILIRNEYEKVANGVDQQLEEAVKELMKTIGIE
jgi:Tol biopolymer transport system component/C-terminal processing protease CtpA/Prc